MTDTDLIACVYPHFDENMQSAMEAIDLDMNKPRYVPGFNRPESRNDSRGRGSTEEPESRRGSDLDKHIHLELRFKNGPKTPHGFVFGRDEDCDIVLPDFRGVSTYHFALTFDDQNRPIVKDLGSFIGTQVTYNGDGLGWRSDFTWIVGGLDDPQEETPIKTPIVIHVNKHLKFQLVVSRHDLNSHLYKNNIRLFRQGTAGPGNLFDRLKFPPDTERVTGTMSPSRRPIFLTKKLGEGSFGVVTRLWNVSTGEKHALKQPSDRSIREKEFDAGSWKKEAKLMGRISHEHIVRLLWEKEEPWPMLCLEYLPGGSLRDHGHLSNTECRQALRQLLSALAYLHGLQPPILHRDIKPDNILVQYRSAGHIHVKFGDFGISGERRESGDWKTVCGTWKYAAPEILEMKKYHYSGERMRESYTAAIDIWSLGVVMFKLLCGLPRYDVEYEHQGTVWGEKILDKLEEVLKIKPNGLLQFLSATMLVLKPEGRLSANECCNKALCLPDESEVVPPHPMTDLNIEDQEAKVRSNDPPMAILRHTEAPPNPDYTEGIRINTVHTTGSVNVGDSIKSTEIQRYIRSNIPLPGSQRRGSGRVSKSSTATQSRRAEQGQLAKSVAQRKEEEGDSDIRPYFQNPVNTICLGSSLSVLEEELPSDWNQSSRTGSGSHKGEGRAAQSTQDEDEATAAVLHQEVEKRQS